MNSVTDEGSMLLAVLISNCQWCEGIWLLGSLKKLSQQDTGLIAVATLLLFPTAIVVYGGLKVWFAAKEAVEKKAMARGRAEGIGEGLEKGRAEGRDEGLAECREEGQQEERERIGRLLKESGMPDESIARILAGQPAAPPPQSPPRPYRRRPRQRNGNGG